MSDDAQPAASLPPEPAASPAAPPNPTPATERSAAPQITYNYNILPPNFPTNHQPSAELVMSEPRAPQPSTSSPPPAASENPPQPLTNDDNNRRGRPTESDLRAESAAYRIEARRNAEERDAAIARAQEAEARIELAVNEERSRWQPIIERNRQRIVDTELRSAAVAAGIVDVDLLPLIDRTGVTVDEDDRVTGIDEAVARYRTAKPDFFRARDTSSQDPPAPLVRTPTGSPITPPPANPNPPISNVRSLSKEDYRLRRREEMNKLRGLR